MCAPYLHSLPLAPAQPAESGPFYPAANTSERYKETEFAASVTQAYDNGEPREEWGKKPSGENQADILLAMTEDFEYFKSGPANEGYVRVAIGDHSEVWPAGVKVREILTHRYLEKYARAPGREALNSVADTVAAKCSMGPKVDVHVRFARTPDAIFLDLCDERWRVVEITASGWSISPGSSSDGTRVPARFPCQSQGVHSIHCDRLSTAAMIRSGF